SVERKFVLRAGERRELTYELKRRTPLRMEGWYTGDNHDHMVHGERMVTVDFAYAALAARSEGLDYLSLAHLWNLPQATPEDLDRECRNASTDDFLLTWNLEAPKNYYRGDVSKCLGHGWTAGMRGRTEDGRDAIGELLALSAHDYESDKDPAANFESHALIHSLGGVVSYSHPCRWWWGKWGGRGIYPVEEKKFVSNMAAELPFDTVAGPTYDTIDVLMQPHETAANDCAQQLWFLLLNKGYRIAASGSTDATFDRPGGGVPGRVRMYTRVRGGFSLAAVAEALKTGRSLVTSGPLVMLEMNGYGSGDVVGIPTCGGGPCLVSIKGRIRAWASGAATSGLRKVELIRNGVVVKTFEPVSGRTEIESGFNVVERERAWYIARCFGADAGHIAITNPVYFEPEGSRPPEPVPARITAVVKDGITGGPLRGRWEVIRMVGKEAIAETAADFVDGSFRLEARATARIRVTVPGYEPLTKSIFLDSPALLESTFRLRTEDLTDWRTFERMRELLQDVRLEFAVKKLTR
ncbi:MAG TPA: CehA/McbA family metallohydrolase, partial [Bryobacteraceae bacterium]|nr:CehA/McbA family metallohydrolase [Bryobacteraceae bacterium]